MNDLAEALSAFHLLRPWWLLVLPVIALIWFQSRKRAAVRALPADGLAPHLRAALTVGGRGKTGLLAIDGVALALALATLGAAGPTWSRMLDPFTARTAPMVIALKVTPSMTGVDLAPSRLERAKHKIRDLLDLRAGARTALIAYAGSAHLAVPMTEDAAVVQPYLDGLAPQVMPKDGDDAGAALALAREMLSAEATPGGVLFVLDALSPSDAGMLADKDAPATAFLMMLPEGVDDPGLDRLQGASVVRASVDQSDVETLDRTLNAAWRRALLDDASQPWDDRGWLLAWPAALLVLLWFRQGLTMRWGLLLGLGLMGAPGGPARAEGLIDWFATPDQQGAMAMEDRDFARAAELFADPMQRSYALYRSGQYETAAAALARIETAEAAFMQGLANIKSRKYRDGVRAFETALARDPDLPGAAENLATARLIVEYVETAREQSDTGESAGIGADDVVYDNEEARGEATVVKREKDTLGLMTTDKWMSMVDTRTGDFLRQRFALESSKRSE